ISIPVLLRTEIDASASHRISVQIGRLTIPYPGDELVGRHLHHFRYPMRGVRRPGYKPGLDEQVIRRRNLGRRAGASGNTQKEPGNSPKIDQLWHDTAPKNDIWTLAGRYELIKILPLVG